MSKNMSAERQGLSSTFNAFFDSEKSSAILLILCMAMALLLANALPSGSYASLWQQQIGGMSLEHWVNEGLMAIFFLLIGLELERELYEGELSNFRNALLPVAAAIGGMLAPALIHLSLNAGTLAQPGFGIPMATDIAFALGALALLGKRTPLGLRVFVVAFAVMDDLGAILLIAVFYTAQLSVLHLAGATLVWTLLIVLNRVRVMSLTPYLVGGAIMWFLTLKSGVHATVAGVALAFAIPFSAKSKEQESPSLSLEKLLHRPVAFVVLPLFALVNTGVVATAGWMQDLTSMNSVGIAAGLILGKPIGILLLCFLAVSIGLCRLPPDLTWRHVFGAGMLGGIGFTMSIFITNLAFASSPAMVNASKMAILLASLMAGILGYFWLRFFARPSGS